MREREGGKEREREKRVWVLTTSLIFMLMHFAALCFHFPPLCLPESRAHHTRPSQGEGRAARENEEKDKWWKGGKNNWPNKQTNTKAFFCVVIKGITYLILAGEEDKERRKGRNGRTERARKSKKEREIRGKRLTEVQRAHTKGRRKEESMRGEERGGRGRQL